MTLIPLSEIPQTPSRPLRDWQAAALPVALEAIEDGVAGVIQACTGAGKSVLLAEVIAHRPPGNGEVVVVTTPTQPLVQQLHSTLAERLGPGWVGRFYTRRKEPSCPVVVACHPSTLELAAELERQGRAVSLWIADEVHRTECPEMHAAAVAMRPAARLGFTATPFRSEASERLRLWERILCRYTPGDALRDGVIVPWRIVPWTGAERVMVDDAVIEMIQRRAPTGPGVVNARTIAGAEGFAARLRKLGIAAEPIHSGQTPRTQEGLLADLRAGDIRCLVYPSLLSEGFDMPELRWMALRRPVQARVRFIQELGRVLRSAEGKKEAVILDPLGLIEQHSLTYEAALGWAEDRVSQTAEREVVEADEEVEAKTLYARPLAAVSAWARQLAVAAIADRLAPPPEHSPDDFWRRAPASGRQLTALSRLSWASRFLPPAHGQAMRRICRKRAIASAGTASDLLTVLTALASRKAEWSPPDTISPPTEGVVSSAGQEAASGDWYAAGAARDGLVSIAVVRGVQVVRTLVRTSKGTQTAACIAAAKVAARCAAEAGEADPLIHLCEGPAAGILTGAAPRFPSEAAAAAMLSPVFRVAVMANNPARLVAWRTLNQSQQAAGTPR